MIQRLFDYIDTLPKKIAVLIALVVITIGPAFYHNHADKKNYINVTGHVIGKGAEDHVHKHSTTRDWLLAIRPDNPQYKTYDISVTFATYCTLNVGDKCTFKVRKDKVGLDCPNYTPLLFIWLVIGIIGIILYCAYNFSE